MHNRAIVKKPASRYEPLLRRRSVLAGALALASAPTFGQRPGLAVGRGLSAARRLQAALAQLGTIRRFVRPGARVLIKPNVGYARDPALGVTTSPELLAALITSVHSAGAALVRVADHPVDPPSAAFEVSGVRDVCRAHCASLLWPTPDAFDGAWGLQGCALFRAPLEDADVVINLANAKAHPLVGIGGASVNLLGLLGGDRAALHVKLADHLTTLNRMVPTTLHIVDGSRVMLSQGPAAGTSAVLRQTSLLCAGTSAAEVDAWAWRHLLQRTDPLPAFIAAARMRPNARPAWA
tara:strand:- start:29 stop:910 length:882 start_codon:yes stop_codon:yes gene_type:complete